MKVIIFGGAGFIGSHFRDSLNRISDIEIRSYDLNPDQDSTFLDVRKAIKINEEFQKDDVIINLAAVHKTPGSPDHDYFETNIKGAENICMFAKEVGIERILFTSSIAPYGASEEEKFEDTLPTPNTPYGISKLVAEYIHKSWASKSDSRKLLILRPGIVFGKGENGNFTRLGKAIEKGLFFYPGRKNTLKACIYVKDLVKLSWILMLRQMDEIETFNFVYQPINTIEDIANTVAKVTNQKKPNLTINGGLLKFVAKSLHLAGLSSLGFHPDRVNKLMTSTNINGKKLRERISTYNFTLEEAIQDWYKDCQCKGLF